MLIDVLRQVSLHRGCKYTNLMLHANISYNALYDITRLLEDKHMIRIEEEKRRRCVYIEQKGQIWLRTIDELLGLIGFESNS